MTLEMKLVREPLQGERATFTIQFAEPFFGSPGPTSIVSDAALESISQLHTWELE